MKTNSCQIVLGHEKLGSILTERELMRRVYAFGKTIFQNEDYLSFPSANQAKDHY